MARAACAMSRATVDLPLALSPVMTVSEGVPRGRA